MDSERIDMTENRILQVLQEALSTHTDDPEGAFTMRELVSITDMSQKKLRDSIGKAMGKGLVECVRVTRMSIDNRAVRVPAYRPVIRSDVLE